MKKTLVLFSILLVGQMVSAQVPILPSRDTNLYYYWWYEDLFSDSTQKVYLSETGETYMCDATHGGNTWFPWRSIYHCAEAAQYLFTDSALSILGLRLCSWTMDDNWLDQADANCADNMNVCVYEKWGDSMYLLGKKHLYHDNQFHGHGLMNFVFRGYPPHEDSCYHVCFQGGIPYREYYFDSPITVTDSFFVSVSFGGDKSSSTIGHLNLCSERLDDTCFLGVDNFPAFRYRFKAGTYDPYTLDFTIHDGWKDTIAKFYLLVFPIVKYGTVFSNCAPVEGLCVSKQEGATFQFEWSDSNMSHLGWEFTYVPDGASPEGGTVETCSIPSASVTVPSGIRYRAFVRPSCIADRYGDWGDGVPFCYNCSSDAVSASDAATQVYPNPTASTVEVVSTYKVLQVDVLDARGVRLLTVTSGGTTISIDLSDYPDGVYLFRVRTDEGTATKQIVKSSHPPKK